MNQRLVRGIVIASCLLAPSIAAANGRGQQRNRTRAAAATTAAPAAAAPATATASLGTRTSASRVAPTPAATTTVGAGLGAQTSTSRVAAGTASQVAAPQRVSLGTTVAGTRVASASATAAPSLGSTIGGSQVATGSQVAAGQGRGSRLGLGSQLAGSQLATGTRVAGGTQVVNGTQVAGSGRYRAIVPAVQGAMPRVSTSRPGAAIFLVDASSSMGGAIAGAQGVSKADAAAEAANNTVAEMVLAHRGGDGRPRDRLQMGVIEYGRTVTSSVPGGRDLVPLSELGDNPVDVIQTPSPQGGTSMMPIWVRPRAEGNTPMVAAFRQARRAIGGFNQGAQTGADGRGRLVLLFNITDGEPTDGDPSTELEPIANEVAAAGNTLLSANIHVSGNPNAAPVLFPTEEQADGFDAYGKKLFEMSSPVPAELLPAVREINPAAANGTPRMMAVNATIEGLNAIIQVGSSLAAATGP